MPWRVIAHGDQVWHVDALAERPANTEAWQLVLSFRSASERSGRSFWTLYPLEATSKSSLFIQAERIRFQDFQFQKLASGRCRAKVVLTWADGRQFTGESDGVISQAGELRCCAEATVRALERVVQPRLGFELLGVKAVRAFDATVIIVSLSARQEARASRLVGACLTETDVPRGAALAVLNATNRILGTFFATR